MNRKCPACQRNPDPKIEIWKHCQSPTCSWIRCPFPDCKQTFDQRGRYCSANN